MNVKEILSEDVKNICNPCHKPTNYLFGDDIGKSIKDDKEAYQLSTIIIGKNSTAKQQYYGHSTFTMTRRQENFSFLLSILPIQILFTARQQTSILEKELNPTKENFKVSPASFNI